MIEEYLCECDCDICSSANLTEHCAECVEGDDDWVSFEEGVVYYFPDDEPWDGEPWDDPYEDWNYESDYVEKVGTGE